MKIPLVKIERPIVQSKPKAARVLFGKGLGCNLSKRRRKRKLIGSPKHYLDYLDREAPKLARKIHSFFKHEALRTTRILISRAGLRKDDAQDIIDNLDMSDWDVLVGVFSDTLTDQAREQAHNEFGTIGFDASQDMTHAADERASEWARSHAAELVGKKFTANGRLVNNPDKSLSVLDTTRDELRDLLSIALDEGMTPAEVAAEIHDGWAFSEARASTIARTELASAHAQGSLAAWKESGVVEMKQAILGSEHDLDDECDENADDGPIPIDEVFSSGDDMHPFHPNCVCVVVALTTGQGEEG